MIDKYYFVKEEVRNSINVLDLLENYNAKISAVKNRKARSNCVIHGGDGSSNFSFDIDKKLWTCYSRHCGEDINMARDVFLFIKLAEEAKNKRNCNFKECLQIASKISGLNIDINTFKYNKEEKDRFENERWIRKNQKTNKQIEILDETLIKLFVDEYHPYIETRGYDDDVIKFFELGYSKYGINEEYINNPRFPGRIIVPIRDVSGGLVGLSGRLATDNKILIKKYKKYQHLVDFEKGLVLYNLNNAKNSIEESKKIIICEGFFDIIRLYTFGVDNAVAVMGTSLTPEQLSLCLIAHEAYICFDNDKAGKLNSIRICEQLKDYMNVYNVVLPNGKDPDNIKNPEEFWSVMSKAERYIGGNT